VQAQDSTIGGLADHLALELQRAEKKHFFPKVLVVDFALKPGGINSLGQFLADDLSDSLEKEIGSARVIDRKQFHMDLQNGGISPFDLADREIAIWISGQVGANAIVFGHVTSSREKLILSTDLIRIGDEKKLDSSNTYLPLTGDLNNMLSKPLDWPASPDLVISCSSAEAGQKVVDTFKAAGVTMPACIHCPQPEYTDEARRAKAQGTLKFDVVVDEQGKAKRIAVVKGDTYGFTARALASIKNWKFKPAMKDGKPVTVCVIVEVMFRLL
jgi:TonB family protein